MRKADAPPAGWYPDPTGRPQLRWWDGLDWTDHRRPRPSSGYQAVAADTPTAEPSPRTSPSDVPALAKRSMSRSRDETAEIMAEVRKVARDEVERATRRISDHARDASRRLEPLISQYGDRVMRWLRNLGIIAIALVVLWMLLQTFAQTTLLDWLGDRIDSLFGGGAAASGAPSAWWP